MEQHTSIHINLGIIGCIVHVNHFDCPLLSFLQAVEFWCTGISANLFTEPALLSTNCAAYCEAQVAGSTDDC
jgi:hypothetical protein